MPPIQIAPPAAERGAVEHHPRQTTSSNIGRYAQVCAEIVKGLEPRFPPGVKMAVEQSPWRMAITIGASWKGMTAQYEIGAHELDRGNPIDVEAIVNRLCFSVCQTGLSTERRVPGLERLPGRVNRDPNGREWHRVVGDHLTDLVGGYPGVAFVTGPASHAPGVTIAASYGPHVSEDFVPQWELEKHDRAGTVSALVESRASRLADHVLHRVRNERHQVGTFHGAPVYAGPTPEQVAAEIRSVRQKIEPAREPLTGISYGRPAPHADGPHPDAVEAGNKALARARQRHKHLEFTVSWHPDERAWRFYAADLDQTKSITVAMRDILATRGADLDADLDRLAGMFTARDPGPTASSRARATTSSRATPAPTTWPSASKSRRPTAAPSSFATS